MAALARMQKDMVPSRIDLNALYQILFSVDALASAYLDRHADSRARGLDRLSGLTFSRVASEQLEVASRKCIDGSYKFTPYLESLKLKDRHSAPRMISIPVVRDRVVLTQLNKFLRLAFQEESHLRLASELVRDLSEDLTTFDPSTTWTAGLDIKKFYDSIDRVRLKKVIKSRLGEGPAYRLISRAIATPTVPKIYKTRDINKYVTRAGVPQGLSISNTLAAIVMHEVDVPMRRLDVSYYRFVDDVLLIGGKEETAHAARSFVARVRARGLSVHGITSTKGHHQPLHQKFSYLGYDFALPLVTVRDSTVERLLHSLASKIADYKYNKERLLARKPYLTPVTLRAAFLDELDERISGAISGNRRYGWIAYFSQINDESMLHRIDVAIRKMLERSDELRPHANVIKRLARAYFEIRFRPAGGYVRNYDEFKTPVQKLNFLVFRGEVGADSSLSEAQINEKFESYRDRQLSEMLADEALTY